MNNELLNLSGRKVNTLTEEEVGLLTEFYSIEKIENDFCLVVFDPEWDEEGEPNKILKIKLGKVSDFDDEDWYEDIVYELLENLKEQEQDTVVEAYC